MQAELFGVCKAAGLNVSLELQTPAGRLDLGLFSSDWSHLLAIVECKSPKMAHKGAGQIRRYGSIGVPVFKWAQMQCSGILKALLAVPSGGVSWESVMAMPKKERWKKHKFNPETDLDEGIIYRN